MEKQLLGPIIPKKKRHRIKRLVLKRKDDFLTAFEKNWRDWLLTPFTKLFYKLKITANQITYLGFILLAVAVIFHFKNYPFKWQFWILVFAAITDALDGSTARNNNNITVLGTWLDHIRDGALVAWATYIIYINNLLNPEILLIVWSLQILLVWIILKDFLFRYVKGLSNIEQKILVNDFSLDNLQASILGRLQFFCWTMGYGLLIYYLMWPQNTLITIGQGLIILEIIFATLNISECYRKSLPK